jgi:hypothetical protein
MVILMSTSSELARPFQRREEHDAVRAILGVVRVLRRRAIVVALFTASMVSTAAAGAALVRISGPATALQPAERLSLLPTTTTTTTAPSTTLPPADAKYVSPTGNDATGDGTARSPWRTFAKALASIAGGGTLVVRNGVYSEAVGTSIAVPSGTAARPTRIVAESDGGAVVDGQGLRTPLTVSGSYVDIEGMKFVNGADNVADVTGNHVSIRRTAFGNAGTGTQASMLTVSGDDVLVEDSWMWGRGKAGVEVSGTRATLRRLVIRNDYYTGTLEFVGVLLYGAADTLIENVIALDFGTTTTSFSWKAGFRSRDMFDTRTQRYFGTIALNIPYGGYRMSDSNYENVIAWDVGGTGGLYEDSYKSGYRVAGATVGDTTGGGINTFLTEVSDSLFVRAGGPNSAGDRNLFASTPVPAGSTNALVADPALLYLPRIESGSPAKGSGTGGRDRGANVVSRYVDGVLTATPLWPWPNEARIKSDFQTNFGLPGVDPTRGFADTTNGLRGTPVTLTSYVWEYLGSPCPVDICG